MTKSNSIQYKFATVQNRYVSADFDGGDITSDGGSLLLHKLDRKLGLTTKAASAFNDSRQKGKVNHTINALVKQQIFALANGYSDLNDHTTLRKDPLMQTICSRDKDLASASTLHRFQKTADRSTSIGLNKVLVDHFLDSHKTAPEEIILDFDATDDPVHGNQEKAFFHGYYGHYCFLPLYVFCGSFLLTAYLRPSNIDGAKHAGAILKILVGYIRKQWPECRIIFRGDGGFARRYIMHWCEKNNVDFIIGYTKNKVVLSRTQEMLDRVKEAFAKSGEKQREFVDFMYRAGTWKRERRIISKAEYNKLGENNRFIVTTLSGDPKMLYDKRYCARGDMENRIKEQQLDLFADRTSASEWWMNQLRMLLSGLAYTLLETLRRTALAETEASAFQCGTIRLKLLKIGAVVVRNTRTVKVHLSSAYPHQKLFASIYHALEAA